MNSGSAMQEKIVGSPILMNIFQCNAMVLKHPPLYPAHEQRLLEVSLRKGTFINPMALLRFMSPNAAGQHVTLITDLVSCSGHGNVPDTRYDYFSTVFQHNY